MNWGKSIIVVFVLFAAFIIFFVVKMINTNTSGVPEGYYEKGLKYTETIQKEEGAYQFGPSISVIGNTISLKFLNLLPDSGELFIQWPPDPAENIAKKFNSVKEEGIVQEVSGPKGFRNARVEFYYRGKSYLFQKRIWVE